RDPRARLPEPARGLRPRPGLDRRAAERDAVAVGRRLLGDPPRPRARGDRAQARRRRRPDRRRRRADRRGAVTDYAPGAATTASPTSRVVAVPPTPRVFGHLEQTVASASRRRAAASASPRWSSISEALQIAPDGFAIPCPAMSGAEPCTGSNRPGSSV